MVNFNKDNMTFEAIGSRLRLARQNACLTQKEFADSIGIAQATYNQYEKGNKRPSVDNAIRFCELYNLTLDWIYTGDPSGLSFQLVKDFKIIQEAS